MFSIVPKNYISKLKNIQANSIKIYIYFITIILIFALSLVVKIPLLNFKERNEDLCLKTSDGVFYSGQYDGGISTLGIKSLTVGSDNIWSNQAWLNESLPKSWEFNEFNYSLNRVDLRVFNIFKNEGNITIATNTSQGILQPQSFWRMVLQEFKTPNITRELTISEMNLYLNFTDIPLVYKNILFSVVMIFDEAFGDPFGYSVIPIEPGVAGWFTFNNISSNVLSPNKSYYIAYWVGTRLNILEPYNVKGTWAAENRTKTDDKDEGLTYYVFNNNVIQIDATENIDMLCNMTYNVLYNPEDINLKYIIDGTEYIPSYQKSTAPGSSGYEAFISYYLISPPNKDINFTIFSSSIIESLAVESKLYFIYQINASGIWQLINNTIQWNVSYPYYYDIGAKNAELWFLYEPDWELDGFYSPIGSETEMFSGAITVYNEDFEGLFNLWGGELGLGTCIGTFYSPNYCSKINPQIKINDQFQNKGYLQLGKYIRFQAEIKDPYNTPISGGIGNITFLSPSGSVLLQDDNLTSSDGVLSSSEMYLGTNLAVGTYQVNIFWMNGKEVAYYTIFVDVRHPDDYIPPETIILLISIVGAVIALVPISVVARRYVRQRNWGKTLRDLFVLTKEGVSMYSYSFGIELRKPELISGMISALTTFSKEATGSGKQLRSIDQEDKKVLLNHGARITVALLCDKDLPIIRKRLKSFSEAFESKFGKQLANWSGETSMFKGAESILTRYFPVSTEEKVIRGIREKLSVYREQIISLDDPVKVVSLMHEITEFSSRYSEIISKFSFKEFNEIIKIAEEKIRTT